MSRMNAKAVRYAITGALAVSLLAGCAASSKLARAGQSHAARTSDDADRAVSTAEAAVALSPQDSAARVALAQAYLDAGRFRSAATTFHDAIALGDVSGRTQLSFALAEIAAGDGLAAVAALDDAADAIPAGDRGLALALAGDTGRGVAILTEALRGGENTPKMRQNLAYAFALDGRWREARLMMTQDVPADQVNDRIGDWAMMSRPEDVQKRVATLLGVPAGVADAGQPERLALANTAPHAQVAAQASAPAPQPADAELPPVDQPAVAVAEPPAPVSVAAAFATPQPGFVSQPVVQAAAPPVKSQRVPARTSAGLQRDAATLAFARRPAAGTHMVQLGSFSSEASARSAWRIFTARNPELRNYRMTITPAVVNGRNFWRVAAAGFDAGSAVRACSGVRSRGGTCFAYAASNAPAGSRTELALGGFGSAKTGR